MGSYIRKTIKGPDGSRIVLTGKDLYIYWAIKCIKAPFVWIFKFCYYLLFAIVYLYKYIFIYAWKGIKWIYNKIKDRKENIDEQQ